MNISVLPTDLLTIIVSFLGASTEFSLMHVSKYFKAFLLKLQPGYTHPISTTTKNKILLDATKYSNVFRWMIPEPNRLLPHNTKQYCRFAIKKGNIEIVKYLWHALLPNDYNYIFIESIMNGRMKIV